MKIKLGMMACAGLLATVGLTFGCGDSTSSGGAGGAATTTTGSGVSTSSSKSGSGTTVSGSTGSGVANDCATFCATIKANCTGMDLQFGGSDAACMTACTPLAKGMSGDMSGATLGCHIYHATAAKTTPDVHCWHASIPSVSDTAPHTAAGPCN